MRVSKSRAADYPGPADPGLQPERTALAWQRTGLALVGLALLVARSHPRPDFLLLTLLASAVGISGMLLILLARVRFHAADRNLRAWHLGRGYALEDQRSLDGRLPLVAAVGATLLAILAAALFIG